MIRFIGIAQKDKEVILYYLQDEGKNTFFKAVSSHDGFAFDKDSKDKYIFVFDMMQQEEQSYKWSNFRIAKEKYEYILTYKHPSENHGLLLGALSDDLTVWHKIGKIDAITETGSVVPKYQHQDQYVMYT